MQSSNKTILLTVFITIFIDMLGVSVLIPIYPLLILPHSIFKVIPDTWAISSGFIMLGWLSTSFPLAQFFTAPILGQLSDRFGRKKILALSIFGTVISYLLFAIAITNKNIPLMFIARFTAGLLGGNIAISQAVIADISSPESRPRNFGLIGAAFGLGFIFGPFIGGKLSDPNIVSWFTAATPFYFISILSLINMIMLLKLLPETLKVKSSNRIHITKPFHNILLAFSREGLRNIMPSTFLFNAGFTFSVTFFAVTLAEKFHFSTSQTGDFFAYTGIMIVIAQSVIVRQIAKYRQDFQVLRFSMFGTAACILVFFLIPANHASWLYYIPPILSAFNALTMSFNGSLVSRVTPINIRGEGLGINSSVIALAQTIPAILSGYIAGIGTSIPLIVGSVVIMLGGICFWLFFNPQQFHTK
jgi:MFS transporter, DHA1 family, tetracycline resistance protein